MADLGSTIFRARVETEGDDPLQADVAIPVVIDRRYACPNAQGPISLDGNAEDWRKLKHSLPDAPLIVGPEGAWQGRGDADVAFDFSKDENKIYFFAQVSDDEVVPGDQIALFLDTRPIADRSREPGFGIGFYRVTFPAVAFKGSRTLVSGANEKTDCEVVVVRQDQGYSIEAAIPAEILTDRQGIAWHSFQASVLLEDVDEQGQAPSRLIWRGTREVHRNNSGYGHFLAPAVNDKGP